MAEETLSEINKKATQIDRHNRYIVSNLKNEEKVLFLEIKIYIDIWLNLFMELV